MLILSRKKNQRFTLTTADGSIEIVVVEICHDRVRFGITAPVSVSIVRDDANVKHAKPVCFKPMIRREPSRRPAPETEVG